MINSHVLLEFGNDCQGYTARLSIVLFVPALTVVTVVSDSLASTVSTDHLESCVHNNAVLCQVFKLSHDLISTPPVAQGEVWPGHGLSTSTLLVAQKNSCQAMVCQWVSTLLVAQGEVWTGHGLSTSICKKRSDQAMVCQWVSSQFVAQGKVWPGHGLSMSIFTTRCTRKSLTRPWFVNGYLHY